MTIGKGGGRKGGGLKGGGLEGGGLEGMYLFAVSFRAGVMGVVVGNGL